MGVLLFVLHFLKTSYLWYDLRVEYYTGGIAVLFIGLGLWAGKHYFDRTKPQAPAHPIDLSLFITEHELSKREGEVLQLILEGKSNQEIADQLFVSLNTIKSHVSSVFSKTGVRRRTQLINLVQHRLAQKI